MEQINFPIYWLDNLRIVKNTKHGEISSPNFLAAMLLQFLLENKDRKTNKQFSELFSTSTGCISRALHYLKDKGIITIEYVSISNAETGEWVCNMNDINITQKGREQMTLWELVYKAKNHYNT